jgi:hypothetical protein
VFAENAMQFLKGVFQHEVGQKIIVAYQPSRGSQDGLKSVQVENFLACPNLSCRHGFPPTRRQALLARIRQS